MWKSRRKNKRFKDLQLTKDRVFRFERNYRMFCVGLLPLRGAYRGSGGFTLAEMIIVVVILAIAAAMAIPMFSSAGSMKAASAADTIAADLEYAKSMAISRGRSYSVVFDTATESYRVEDQDGVVIAHPVKKGFNYVVDFRKESSLSGVDMTSANFGGTGSVTFDFLGSPDNGGTVGLSSGGFSVSVIVEPVTGFISISD